MADKQTAATVDVKAAIERAATFLKHCDAILFTSGAGLGVDSGLPDFRGPQGFWKAYPPMEKLGLAFSMMSNPVWFTKDPAFAWGFWSHRYNLYKSTNPHAGFQIMKRWGEGKKHGYFVFTSNVDGQHQKAGFPEDKIVECHGTVHWAQCSDQCTDEIWPTTDFQIPGVDESTFKAIGALPTCKKCKSVLRPNVLMFGDSEWVEDRTAAQEKRIQKWSEAFPADLRVAVIEIGAGTAVPTIRFTSESFVETGDRMLIRINPTDTRIPAPHKNVCLPLGGLAGLQALDEAMKNL